MNPSFDEVKLIHFESGDHSGLLSPFFSNVIFWDMPLFKSANHKLGICLFSFQLLSDKIYSILLLLGDKETLDIPGIFKKSIIDISFFCE